MVFSLQVEVLQKALQRQVFMQLQPQKRQVLEIHPILMGALVLLKCTMLF